MSNKTINSALILKAIQESETPLTKRDLAHMFDLRDTAKIELKKVLKELQNIGEIEQLPSRAYAPVNAGIRTSMPSVTVLEIAEITLDGDILATAASDDINAKSLPERIWVLPQHGADHAAPAVGDRILARIKFHKSGEVTAQIMRKLDSSRERIILGRVTRVGAQFWLQPVGRKEKDEFLLSVPADQVDALEHGALAEAIVENGKQLRRPRARLQKIIGHDNDPRAISLIALHEQGLRTEFPDAVIKQTKDMVVPPLGKREDLRQIPLVTIDGADARDFDDAVFAQKTENGYHIIVAIADVAHYVTYDSPLDKEAFARGNSTYFPDRVLPMLPERLSNDLCSLRPHEDRAALAVHLYIDDKGHLTSYKFVRALMRSAARLTYDQVQAAYDGVRDDATDVIFETVIKPLYDAYKVLAVARDKRGALDLDMPERQIMVDAKGNMTGVRKRERFDSHKLIEEFMILANVAAAQALEAKNAPCIYRVHDTPSSQKIDAARTFLQGFGLNLARGQVTKPSMFNGILHKVQGMDYAQLVSQIILRAQSQAVYHPKNIGHFGLALQKYAHFTSPIRRYADLIVHRSLIRAYDLGDGGLHDGENARLTEIAEHITTTERASMLAERASVDRFTAAYLSTRIGETFTGRITAVTRFGLFIALDDTGADGLVPIRSLPQDFYIHSEDQHALIGRRSGRIFRLCAPVRVRVVEADRLTGSSMFELIDAHKGAEVPGFKMAKPHMAPEMPKGKRPFKKSKSEGGKTKKFGKKTPGKRPKRDEW